MNKAIGISVAFAVLISGALAGPQMTVYAKTADGEGAVYGVNVELTGNDGDTVASKSSEPDENFVNFFESDGFEPGNRYEVRVEEQNGNRFGSVERVFDSGDGVKIELSETGEGPGEPEYSLSNVRADPDSIGKGESVALKADVGQENSDKTVNVKWYLDGEKVANKESDIGGSVGTVSTDVSYEDLTNRDSGKNTELEPGEYTLSAKLSAGAKLRGPPQEGEELEIREETPGSGSYSVSEIDVNPRDIERGDNPRFSAEISSFEDSKVGVEWFLFVPRGGRAISSPVASKRNIQLDSGDLISVSAETSYSDLRQKVGTGEFEVGAQIVEDGEEKATAAERVPIEIVDSRETEISFDTAPDEKIDVSREYTVSATAKDSEGKLTRQSLTLFEEVNGHRRKEVNGHRRKVASELCGPRRKQRQPTSECTVSTDDYSPSETGDVDLEAKATTVDGRELSKSTSFEAVESDSGYSISHLTSDRKSIHPGQKITFGAEVTSPKTQDVAVDWFLRPKGKTALSGVKNVQDSNPTRVERTVSYEDLVDRGFNPGEYTLSARIAVGGDQKAPATGERPTVIIEERGQTGVEYSLSELEASPSFVGEGDELSLRATAESGEDTRLSVDWFLGRVEVARAADTFGQGQEKRLLAEVGYEELREKVGPGEYTLGARIGVNGDQKATPTGNKPSVTIAEKDQDAAIHLVHPENGDPVHNPVELEIRLKGGDASRYECYWSFIDSDVALYEFNEMSRDGNSFTDRHTFRSGNRRIHFQCERDDKKKTDVRDLSFKVVEGKNEQGPVADLDITPESGFEGETEFTFDASGSTGDEFEFDFDGDGDIDQSTENVDVLSTRIYDTGTDIEASVKVFKNGESAVASDTYTVLPKRRQPTARLEVTPRTRHAGDTFTFDASGSRRADKFEFDFDGDGSTDKTTSSDTVTRVIDRTGNFEASVEVSNNAGSRKAFDRYEVEERPDPVAEITVRNPLEGEHVNPPVHAQIRLSQDGSRYECFYDDDSIDVVESGRDSDEDSGSLSGSGNRFEASVPSSDLQEGDTRLFFQCERGDGKKTGTKSVSFTVEEEGSAPTARFSVSNPSPGVNEQIQFDARSSSDPDGDIVNYDFNFGNGFTSNGIQTTHSYTDPGVYTVRLVVVDSEGRTDTTTRTVNVQDLSPPPQGDKPPSAGFTFAPQIPRAGDTLRLRSTATDPDNDIDFRNWRLETPDGGEFDFDSGIRASYKAEKSGTYTVTHTIRDSNDNSDLATRDIVVSETENSEPSPAPPPPQDDSPPEADFIFTPQSPQTGTEVVFQSTATDPDNDIDFRNWRLETPEGREFDFSSGTIASYTPQSEGVYSVTHRVRDSGDRTDTATQLVQVTDGDVNRQCGVDVGSVSRLELDPKEVSEGEESDLTVEVDNNGPDQDVRVEFVSFDFSTGDSETIDTVEREIEEGDEERFESEVETDSDSRITAEVFTEGDECGDRFITSTSERLEFSGQQEEDGVVRFSTFTRLGGGVDAFVTLAGPEDKAVNVGGDGRGSLSVEPGSYEATARFSGNVRRRSIDVGSGEVRPVSFTFPGETVTPTETATGLTARLSGKEVDAGQRVTVRGDVRGTSGSQTVQLYSGAQKVSSTSSARDGSYTVSFVPSRVGELSLSVRSGGESAGRSVRVLPTSSVLSVDAPRQVFEGDQFQVCGRVQTQGQAEVSLLRDGEDLASKSGSGEVCFDTTARDIGDSEYTVRSSTYGNGNQKSITVEVLEDQAEASLSTDQVATVETESGTVRVSIYNNNNEKQTYKADLTGIPDTWAEVATREIVLQPGEERDIYFYTTPREEGDFNPQIQVTEGARTVFEEDISLETGGQKTQEQVSGGGLFDFVLSSLTLA
jgi:PKD repeat protein